MKPLFIKILLTAMLAVCLLAGPVYAALPLEIFADSPPSDVIVQGGELLPSVIGDVWHVTEPHRNYQHREYMLYTLTDEDRLLLAVSGTLDLNLVNLFDKPRGSEGVIEFLDSNRKSIITVKVVLKSDGSYLSFDGEKWPVIWGGGSAFRPVAKGEPVSIRFTWGPDPGLSNHVFIDGKKLKMGRARNQSISSMTLVLTNARYIKIGGLSYEANTDFSGGRPSYSTGIQKVLLTDEILIPGTDILSIIHDAFSVAGYSGRLVEGDKFTVIIKAEPGGTATFDLGPVKGHKMTEDPDNPGTYIGTHIVKYGEDVEDGAVTGHFVNTFGIRANPLVAKKTVTVDTRVYMDVNSSNDLIPADEESKAGITIVAKDANDKPVRDHKLLLTMSTTDEYTGILGGGSFEDMVGGEIDVDWGGVTDSFGEVTAQYQSGFAAKTILVSAKDMVSGDVGVGYVRSYITGTVDVLVKRPQAMALSLAGSMEVSLSRDWLTADGSSRSRITVVVKDQGGKPVEGHNIQFTLHGDNGKIRTIKSWTDSRGRAFADYIAGTVIGEVQIEVRDMTGGHVAVVSIGLRPDAPAEIALTAEPGEVFTDNAIGSVITAKVTDANGNPNFNTDVLFEVASGSGTMSADSAVTDEKDGIASVSFFPGSEPGLSTIKATVMSRAATTEEIAAAEGAVFLFGLDDDPGWLEVIEWLAEPDDEVTEGQDLVKLEDRHGTLYTVVSPRDGIVATFVAEERDRVEYGQTLGYVLPVPE